MTVTRTEGEDDCCQKRKMTVTWTEGEDGQKRNMVVSEWLQHICFVELYDDRFSCAERSGQ
jgi:hypothetical protein